ncbi:hypothetical protein ILUMI_04702, partial [Ignelater luminosus]
GSLLNNINKSDFSKSSSWNLTDYVLDVACISGFVVKSLKGIGTCATCLSLLESESTLYYKKQKI